MYGGNGVEPVLAVCRPPLGAPQLGLGTCAPVDAGVAGMAAGTEPAADVAAAEATPGIAVGLLMAAAAGGRMIAGKGVGNPGVGAIWVCAAAQTCTAVRSAGKKNGIAQSIWGFESLTPSDVEGRRTELALEGGP